MKTYHLGPPAGEDVAPAFVVRMSKWAKATNEIAGVVRGLLADGVVSESEVVFLREWIAKRQELLLDPLVRSLAQRIERVFADGVVTDDELAELKSLFHDYAGSETKPTALPICKPPPEIIFQARTFCFTGTFVSGTRKWCIEQILRRGGIEAGSINDALNYLVIGSKVSGAWVNQTYGRKIEAAADFRERGHPIAIVNEDHWLTYLG